MPYCLIALLVNFLEQNNGKFSNRAKEKEFQALTVEEIVFIDNLYKDIF